MEKQLEEFLKRPRVRISERDTGIDPYKTIANILNRIEMREYMEKQKEKKKNVS